MLIDIQLVVTADMNTMDSDQDQESISDGRNGQFH